MGKEDWILWSETRDQEPIADVSPNSPERHHPKETNSLRVKDNSTRQTPQKLPLTTTNNTTQHNTTTNNTTQQTQRIHSGFEPRTVPHRPANQNVCLKVEWTITTNQDYQRSVTSIDESILSFVAMSRHAVPCHVTSCHVMLCHPTRPTIAPKSEPPSNTRNHHHQEQTETKKEHTNKQNRNETTINTTPNKTKQNKTKQAKLSI